jgi:hypothetical protein
MVLFSSRSSVKFHAELLSSLQMECATFSNFCTSENGILLCTNVAARGLDISDVVRFWPMYLLFSATKLLFLLTQLYVLVLGLCCAIRPSKWTTGWRSELTFRISHHIWTELNNSSLIYSGIHSEYWAYHMFWKRKRKCIIVLTAPRIGISYFPKGTLNLVPR